MNKRRYLPQWRVLEEKDLTRVKAEQVWTASDTMGAYGLPDFSIVAACKSQALDDRANHCEQARGIDSCTIMPTLGVDVAQDGNVRAADGQGDGTSRGVQDGTQWSHDPSSIITCSEMGDVSSGSDAIDRMSMFRAIDTSNQSRKMSTFRRRQIFFRDN